MKTEMTLNEAFEIAKAGGLSPECGYYDLRFDDEEFYALATIIKGIVNGTVIIYEEVK